MVSFTPVDKEVPPAVPDAMAADKPVKFTPVESAAAPPGGGAPAADPQKPVTVGSVVKNAVNPWTNLPKDIWHDVAKGVDTFRKGIDESVKAPPNMNPGKPGNLGAAKAALGLVEIAGAPISGAARALIGDPFRKVIPQDTVLGKQAANLLEDAAAMFGPGAIGEVSSAISKAPTAIRTLMEGGVHLTLGQLEPKILKRMEEAAKSVPIVGSFIRAAENRTLDSFNVATAQRALSPLDIRLEAKNGREAIQEGQKLLDAKYNEVRSKVPALHQDGPFDADMTRLRMKIDEMPPGHAARVEAVLTNRVLQRFGSIKAMDGAAFKQTESELTTIANNAKASSDGAERDFGYAVDEIRAAMRDALGRQYPAIAAELKEINHAYGRFADIERAASNRATSGGRFTPGDLLTSIKRADKSPRDRNFAAANRPMQDWAETAYEVIGNKLPDSGTTERALWDVGGGLAAYMEKPELLAWLFGGSMPYTKAGQKTINAAAQGAPDALNAAGRTAAQSGPVGAAAAAGQQSQ